MHRRYPDAIFAQLKNGHTGTRRPDVARSTVFYYFRKLDGYRDEFRSGVAPSLRQEFIGKMREYIEIIRGYRDCEQSRLP